MGKRKSNSVGISTDAEWQAQSDLRTLAEAKAIKADPKRVKAVQELAQKQMVAAAGAMADNDADD